MKKKKQTRHYGLKSCAILCATMLLQSGCATPITGDFCTLYTPVFPDYTRDTQETLRQIEQNNVVYDACDIR